MEKDDYVYIPFFKQLEDGSHIHLGKLVEININKDPANPKIVYLGDVLDEAKRFKTKVILKMCAKVFSFSYQDM